MLSFHGILLPQRRTLEWKDNTSDASPSCSGAKERNTRTDAHINSLTHTHTRHKRLSSTYQSRSASCSTCEMRTQWEPTRRRTALLCNYTPLIYIALTAPADSRQLQIEITPGCQVHMHAHTNTDMFGILLHNRQRLAHSHLHPRNVWEKVLEEEIAREGVRWTTRA